MNHHLFGSPLPTEQGPDDTCSPIRQLSQSTFSSPDPVIEMVRRHTGISEEAELYWRICINEALQNVQDHAKSWDGAIIGAHWDSTLKTISVAVVDTGIGCFESLKTTYPDIPNAETALRRVTSGGYSARSRRNNLGAGINNISTIAVNQLKGEICILSDNAISATSIFGWDRFETLSVRFPGTGVFIRRVCR
jgi:anti-sigma regulatory factor (Ser/Thr protein kinase)